MSSWSLPYPQVNPLLCSSGKNLSWGHYTEKPLCGTSAMWQGENLDSVVVLLREHGQARAVGRQGQQNWPWALGTIRSKSALGEHPSSNIALASQGPRGEGRSVGAAWGGHPSSTLVPITWLA